jgi:hypothetical protein
MPCLSPSSALAAIGLGVPLLAWGLLAVAVPIVVHLILRERPRREVFPAMRFLMHTHASATRQQRLRQLLLLLARVGLIALAVGVLGRLGCTQQGGSAGIGFVSTAATPASVVICIDNSAGMAYRYQGRTRVQAATEWATNILQDEHQFGPGSQYAVICGSPDATTNGWRDNVRAAMRALDSVHPAYHNYGVPQLLAQAYTLMSAARYDRREIYVFTDLTETSMADAAPPAPAKSTRVFLMDVGQNENRNVALAWPRVPNHAINAGIPFDLPVRVINGDLPAEPVVEFSVDGEPRGRQSAGTLVANSQADVRLRLPALDPGAHAVSLKLEPADALACDNDRCAWIMAGDLPRVSIVQPAGGNDVSRMLRAMIDPPTAPLTERRYSVDDVPIESLLESRKTSPAAVILADVKSLNGLAWEMLSGYVKAGGLLIVIPGDAVSFADYALAGNLLPASIEGVAVCDPPLRPAATDLTHPYLQPFNDTSIDSVNDRHAFKRLVLGTPAANTTVIFPFSDGSPALLERTVEKGRVILAAFSVTAEWGQFGTQAAPTIVLLHRILDTARPPLENLASFTAGRTPLRRMPSDGAPVVVTAADGRQTPLQPTADRQYRLPVETPQVYQTAEKSDPRAVALYYSVNVDEGESLAARLSNEEAQARTANESIRIIHSGDPLATTAGSGSGRVSWVVPLTLALLVLLLIESSFANRFYGSRGF